jgi:hypothetical protein
MVAEHLHPSSAAISFELREQLRLHREPPKTFSVWVGFYADMGLLLGIEHHSGAFYYSEPGAEPSMALNTQATAIGLGRLFFQVAQSDAPGVGFQLKDEGVSKLRRIWPPVGTGDIPWPPPLALDATDIATILRGIHNAFEDRLI